jgi:hypothetical protein
MDKLIDFLSSILEYTLLLIYFVIGYSYGIKKESPKGFLMWATIIFICVALVLALT